MLGGKSQSRHGAKCNASDWFPRRASGAHTSSKRRHPQFQIAFAFRFPYGGIMNGRVSISSARRCRSRRKGGWRRRTKRGLFDASSIGVCIIAAALLALIWRIGSTPSVRQTDAAGESRSAFGRSEVQLQGRLEALQTDVQSVTRSAENGKIDATRMKPIEARLQQVLTLVDENATTQAPYR
jgi:hypothetical protein